MRFGGHETFSVREGWLFKGLRMLIEDPDLLGDEFVADHLGVGRNMAKSIRHWLVATELAYRGEGRVHNKTPLRVTELGRLVNDHDPYFLEIGTWWALHANLVRNRDDAATWVWFFND